MNQETDWYNQNTGPMVQYTADYRRGLRGRDEFNTYSARGRDPYNRGIRNQYNQCPQPYQQTGNSYGFGIRREPPRFALVGPITEFAAPVDSVGVQDTSLKEEPPFPKLGCGNLSTNDSAFATLPPTLCKPSVGHGPPPLPPISNLEVHTPHALAPGFQINTRNPPPPIWQLDLARPPPGWKQNGIGCHAVPFLPSQSALSEFSGPPARYPEVQQVTDGRNQRWPNNQNIEASPALDVRSTVSERSDALGSGSLTSFQSNVKEEEEDDDDEVICVTDLNTKSNQPPLDTFIRFLDRNYSGLFQILDRVSGNELLSIMETFIKNLENEIYEIDDKITLWMHLNVVMISATQEMSLVNLELENYMDLMDRFFDTYFKLMKQIFQQAWELGQVPDCKDIAVNCILVVSRCFFNRYDRILHCFLERQIPMEVKGLPQVWCQILSYLLAVQVDNFLEDDAYRIYLIWQKFRVLCDTSALVQKMDKVVTKRLNESGSMTDNFHIRNILRKQRSDKTYNWWDMSQDYFKYMQGKKRTALESYNYSYMYPGNPEPPSSCYIAPSRISCSFKPFFESLSAWSRDDEVARLFDRTETDFSNAKREMEKGYTFPKIDLSVLPDYVDPHFVPPKPKPIVAQTIRGFRQRRNTPSKSRVLRNSSTIVISDSEDEGDSYVLSSSPSDKIVDLTSLEEKSVIIINEQLRVQEDNVINDKERLLLDNSKKQIGEAGQSMRTAENEGDSQDQVKVEVEEETQQKRQDQYGAKRKESLDVLTETISEPTIKVVQSSEQCINGTGLNISIVCDGPSSKNGSDVLPKSMEKQHREEKHHMEENMNVLYQSRSNKPLRSLMPGTEGSNVNEEDANRLTESLNEIESNGLLDRRIAIPDGSTVEKNDLNKPNQKKQIIQSETIILSGNSSTENMLHGEAIIENSCPREIVNTYPNIVETVPSDTFSELNANTLVLTMDRKLALNESDANEGKSNEPDVTSLTENWSNCSLVHRNMTAKSSLNNWEETPVEETSLEETELNKHNISSPQESPATESRSKDPLLKNLDNLKNSSEDQTVTLMESSFNKLNKSSDEASTLKENMSNKQLLPSIHNGSSNESKLSSTDITICEISEEHASFLTKISSAEVKVTTVEVDSLEQNMSTKQDAVVLLDSDLSGSKSNRLDVSNSQVVQTCSHEQTNTLLNNSSTEENPTTVKVGSLGESISNKQDATFLQKIIVNEIESSTPDLNNLNVSEVQTGALDSITVSVSEIEQHTSEKQLPDGLSTVPPEIIPEEPSSADLIQQPFESDDNGFLRKQQYETSDAKVTQLEVSSDQCANDIAQPASLLEGEQALSANHYSCCGFVQEACSKDKVPDQNYSWRDNSALFDETSQESNTDTISKPVNESCKESNESGKRKRNSCTSSVGVKRSNTTWWAKASNEGTLPSKRIPEDLNDNEDYSDDYRLPDTSDIASPPFKIVNKNKVMKRLNLIGWKSGDSNSSSCSTTTNDTSSSFSDTNNDEAPMDLRNVPKSVIGQPLETPLEKTTEKLIAEQPSNCRDLYEGFLKRESKEGGESLGLLTPEWTFDQQYIDKDGVQGNAVPGTSQSFGSEMSQIAGLDDNVVSPEENPLLYPSLSPATDFANKKSPVRKYRSAKKKVAFSVGQDELFQNGLEGPVGKPMPHMGGIASNFLWSDSDPSHSVSVKPDSQLMERRTVKRESIPKKSNVKKNDNDVKINDTVVTDALKNQPRLIEKQHEDVFYQNSLYFNESQSFHLNDIGTDPFPYLGLPVVFGDGFKNPSPSEDFALAGTDSTGVRKDNAVLMSFNRYEPAEVPLKYPTPELTPAPCNEIQAQRDSAKEVKLALPPKKRKLPEEEELKIIVAKYMEDLEQSEKMSYPAERQISIADLQRDCPKIRTLAARKEYPTADQMYQKSAQPTITEDQNVGYQKYPDQCPDQRGTITNIFINGVQHFSHKVNMPSAKPFWVMLGPIDSEGQWQAPVLEQAAAVQETMPALPPVKAKRGRKPNGALKPPSVKRGRRRPRKYPL